MKVFVILLALIGFAGFAYAEETFSGHSSVDPPVSEITPRKPTAINVLFQYTSGPYAITNLTPQVEITPESAKEHIKIDVEPIELNRGDIRRIPIMVTADKDIPHEKIFLSISFSGKHFQTGSTFTSSWFESVTLDIAPKDVIGIELGDCKPIEIDHEISAGKASVFCKSQRTNSVKAFVDANNNGTLTLDIPKHILYGIGSTDCKLDNNFFVIYDGEDTAVDITGKDDSNTVSVDFESGIHEIEIIGTFILPDPSPVQYCGIVENYPNVYLPPLDQIQHNMKPSQIRCNDGLVLLQKYDDSPACVTEPTKTKLIERGWAKIWEPSPDDNSSIHVPERRYDARWVTEYNESFPITHKNNVTNDELKEKLEIVRNSGLGIVSSGIDYDIGQIVLYSDDLTIKEEIKEVLGDFPFILLFEETPARWIHGGPKPEPEPEPIPEAEQLERQMRLTALNEVQEILQTDYRGNELKINAIKEYVDKFESDYFMKQFLYALKDQYKKGDMISFTFAEWGYQDRECTSPLIKAYLKPYDNYTAFGSIEKIYEWQNSRYCDSLEPYLDGYLILNHWRMPDFPDQYRICTVPGEYKIFASSIDGESPESVGSFTCQREMLQGEPQPWMELPD